MQPGVTIREGRLPQDRDAVLRFIVGLQQFERTIEPDRRIDAAVADEFYAVVVQRLQERHGVMFIAEDRSGSALGWAQAHESENEVYVVADERRFAHIAELYVMQEARGRGIGKALIAACETWAAARSLTVITISALAQNGRAFGLYTAAGYAPYVTELRKYLR